MRPATGSVYTTGSGSVACVSGTDDATNKLKCTWKYIDLNATAVSAAHLHVGTDAMDGNPTFFFDVSALVDVTAGTVYQSFVSTVTTGTGPHWVQQGTVTFDAQVSTCSGANGCYFNLHTTPYYPNGELRCELAPLTNTYSYNNVVLAPTTTAQGAVNNTNSAGVASVWMAPVSSAAGAVHAWGYQVAFTTGSPITISHIHQGSSTTDNNGPVKVTFDTTGSTSRTAGTFVGVAMEGITTAQQPSAWPTYTADFDTAIASSFCYINVHTVTNGGGEIRANIAPQGSSASHVAVTLMAVVFVIASWVSM